MVSVAVHYFLLNLFKKEKTKTFPWKKHFKHCCNGLVDFNKEKRFFVYTTEFASQSYLCCNLI